MSHSKISSGDLKQSEEGDIEVAFFCFHPQHHPRFFDKYRSNECMECPRRCPELWYYFCSQCDSDRQRVCHFSAKHIKNHVKNKHGGRRIKKSFAASTSSGDLNEAVYRYKAKLTELKRKAKQGKLLELEPISVHPQETWGTLEQPMDALLQNPISLVPQPLNENFSFYQFQEIE